MIRKLFKRMVKLLLIVAGVLVFVFILLFNNAFRKVKSETFNIPLQQKKSWSEIFEAESTTEVQTITTGKAYVDLYSMVKETSPDIRLIPKGITPMSISAFHVRHDSLGDIMIDLGLNKSFSEKPPDGDLPLILRILNRVINLKFEQLPGENITDQFSRLGIVPQKVFATHLHGDHFAAITELPANIEFIFGKGEVNFFTKAMGNKYLKNKVNLKTIDFSKGQSLPPFSSVIDLLGDGSLWALSTPGHSVNHISYLVITKTGPVLIPGDAVSFDMVLKYDFELTEAGAGKKAYKNARESLQNIREFVKQYPQVKILYSHAIISGN